MVAAGDKAPARIGNEPQLEPSAIRFLDVRLTFAANEHLVQALDGVNFSVPQHKITTVVGPSGCGKTTLLRLASGLMQASGGVVEFFGAPVTGLNTKVGYVTQDSNLFPWLTAQGNAEFPLAIRGMPVKERREKARHWLDLVGLTGFEDHYPSQLSGGMQKRVAIVRTLIYEPSVVLLDEPFGALDSLTRDQLVLDLQQLWMRQQMTVLFITHSIAEAVFLSDRVVVMSPRPGRIDRVIQIDLPRPRTLAMRDTPEFAAYSRQIMELFLARGVLNEHAGGLAK